MTDSTRLFLRGVVPTGLTLGNAIAGFGALVSIHRFNPHDLESWGNIYLAIGLLMLAMVFDALDGLVARLLRCANDFGAELDSLCDGISFGLVPSYLMIVVFTQPESSSSSTVWGLVASLYLAGTLLRLARFNLERTSLSKADGKKFVGLPSPAAAGCICGIVLIQGRLVLDPPFATWIPGFSEITVKLAFVGCPMAAAFIAFLMISRIGFPHPSRKLLGPNRPQPKKTRGRWFPSSVALVAIVGFTPVWIRSLDMMIALVFWWFALNGPFQALLRKIQKKSLFIELPAKAE